MIIERYCPGRTEDLAYLLELRKMPKHFINEVPFNGYIAIDRMDGVPVAAGFLRMMEGSYGVLDSFITNPGKSCELRAEALETLTKDLIELGKAMSLLKLFAFSLEGSLMERACRHGFKRVPYEFTERLL